MDKDKIFYRKLKIIYLILTLFILLGSCITFSNINSKAENFVYWNFYFSNGYGSIGTDEYKNYFDFNYNGNDENISFGEGGCLSIKGEKGQKINITITLKETYYQWGVPLVSDGVENLKYYTPPSNNPSGTNINDGTQVYDVPLEKSNEVSVNDLIWYQNENCMVLVYFKSIDTGKPEQEHARTLQICGTLETTFNNDIFFVDTGTYSDISVGVTDGYVYYHIKNDDALQNYKNFTNTVGNQSVVEDTVQNSSAYFYSNTSIARDIGDNFTATNISNSISSMAEAVSNFQDLINILTNTAFAFAIITAIISCSISVFKISTTPSHPIQRRQALIEIGSCFICIAILGSIKLVTNLIILTIL